MRNIQEQTFALECLKLAVACTEVGPLCPVDRAAQFYAFVTGEDADDSRAKLAAVREVVG